MPKDALGHGSNPRSGSESVVGHYTQMAARIAARHGADHPDVKTALEAAARAEGNIPPVSPLSGMTQARWNGMTPAQRDAVRDNSDLSSQLNGLEGHKVQVQDTPTSKPRNFIVGKSTGWRPVHLEIKTSRSSGGGPANKSYHSVRSLGKVR